MGSQKKTIGIIIFDLNCLVLFNIGKGEEV